MNNKIVRTEFDDRVEYRLNGKFHRLNGPAIEAANGDKSWYKEGRLHRTDGPAIELAYGSKCWYQNGELHRTDGPAIEYANGTKKWYQEGKLHRTDGPAIEWVNGNKSWWVEGSKYTEEEFLEKMNSEVVRTEFDDRVEYRLNGKLHRTDGPAIEYDDGDKLWYVEGRLHRLDGPAVEWANGIKEWWIEGKKYTQEKFLKRTNQKSGKNMSYKDQIKSDMTKVAYRQGARKLTSISHAAILHVFRQQGFSESKLNILLEFLESNPGKALLSYGLGKGLEQVMIENETAQTLAEEFRVSGMDLGVESGLDKVVEKGLQLTPAMLTLLSAVEKTSQEGVNLETIKSFQKVENDLPEEYRQELNNLSKLTRIDSSGPDSVETEEDLESLPEEENTATKNSFYSACS